MSMSTHPAPLVAVSAEVESGKQPYNRFAISMPAAMAEDIRQICHRESRSHSEFFREAVRAYLHQRQSPAAPALHAVNTHSHHRAAPHSEPVVAAVRELRPSPARDDAFADFTEWADDPEYNQLAASGLSKG
jgi:Arc/MetJ-type ribon-helix-helix transcriptional regulator